MCKESTRERNDVFDETFRFFRMEKKEEAWRIPLKKQFAERAATQGDEIRAMMNAQFAENKQNPEAFLSSSLALPTIKTLPQVRNIVIKH